MYLSQEMATVMKMDPQMAVWWRGKRRWGKSLMRTSVPRSNRFWKARRMAPNR